MKCLALLFFATVLSVTCWGDISPKNEIVYQESWTFFKQNKKTESIDICEGVLKNPHTSHIDRLHFLVSLTIFRDEENDRDEIQKLIKEDSECFYEYELYYN